MKRKTCSVCLWVIELPDLNLFELGSKGKVAFLISVNWMFLLRTSRFKGIKDKLGFLVMGRCAGGQEGKLDFLVMRRTGMRGVRAGEYTHDC